MSRRKIMGGGPLPFPNSAMPTEGDVPLGLPVLTRAYGHFNGSNHLTINKAQTIGVDWTTIYSSCITPVAPNDIEVLYYLDLDFNFYLDPSTDKIKCFGNGLAPILTTNTLVADVENNVKLEIKLGSIRITLNGVATVVNVTWEILTWNRFILGKQLSVGEYYYTGSMYNVIADGDDGLESWPLNGNLDGSLGNDAVLTGSTEAVFFDNETGYAVKQKRYVGRFNGANYLTINKPQTIGADYQCFYEAEFTPELPSDFEVIYSPTHYRCILSSSTTAINFQTITGGTSAMVGNYITGAKNKVKLEFKTGFIRSTINGVVLEQAYTFVETTWNSFILGRRSGSSSLFYTGQMWNVSDHEENWPLNGNLKGSLGNDAVLTGSTEAVFFGSPTLVAL